MIYQIMLNEIENLLLFLQIDKSIARFNIKSENSSKSLDRSFSFQHRTRRARKL